MTRTLLGGSLVALGLSLWLGCQCGDSPADAGADVTPAAGGETDAGGTAAPVADEGPALSPEVAQLIDAGDPIAIANDLEKRALELQALVRGTAERAGTLETTAESMTGRKESVDPSDPAQVETLIGTAGELAKGAGELLVDVERAEQLVRDLEAEAEALYGRPVETALPAAAATDAPSPANDVAPASPPSTPPPPAQAAAPTR